MVLVWRHPEASVAGEGSPLERLEVSALQARSLAGLTGLRLGLTYWPNSSPSCCPPRMKPCFWGSTAHSRPVRSGRSFTISRTLDRLGLRRQPAEAPRGAGPQPRCASARSCVPSLSDKNPWFAEKGPRPALRLAVPNCCNRRLRATRRERRRLRLVPSLLLFSQTRSPPKS